ncbi:Zinc finger protein Pegasus [Cocos nucifera]|uniref:Zinc finger protein Pegasus n=1 Tax=Cocos nucifera TaxID=13894 RepID=A0A8K0N932_COCNU|nr:Zinc finger protein Pegasus [Cocos nucifera]
MGGICSKRSAVDKSPSETTLDANGLRDSGPMPNHSHDKIQCNPTVLPIGKAVESRLQQQSFSNSTVPNSENILTGAAEAEPQLSRALSQKSRKKKCHQLLLKFVPSVNTNENSSDIYEVAKYDLNWKYFRFIDYTGKYTMVSEVSSYLGRAGTVGLGKAVEVLDTLGSSMTSLHLSSAFVSATTTKGNKISILAFEVANTIVKGANLMQSLSKENIKHLKEEVLPSEGVQHLISKDMDELLRIAAADKREELKVFSKEVVRFGNRCKDPQWHNLDRYFDKLASELTTQEQLKEAEAVMQQLLTSVQYTAELYHELHALDRFEQDYRRKHQEEDSPNAVQRGSERLSLKISLWVESVEFIGDNLQILRQELKSQKKHVKGLKKRSLWSKNLEEVMEKLVDIVHFLHLKIHDAFGSADGDKPVKASVNSHKRLGPAGLALHYANIISQIDTLDLISGPPKGQALEVSRSSSVPQNTRDALYQGLPPSIKCALRSKLQLFQAKEELTVPQIKAEMEKTLRWLVPIANNTTKAHHGFGWVGEWANTGSEVNRKPAGQTDLIRIETLHHADKEKTEGYILDLVVWLHHLISLSRSGNGGVRSPIKSPVRSPTQKPLTVKLPGNKPSPPSSMLTQEDQEMLRDVNFRKLTPGISKSQEFDMAKTRPCKHNRLSKSNSHSPTSSSKKDFFSIRRPSMVPIIDFDIDKLKALDVIDRVDDLRKL